FGVLIHAGAGYSLMNYNAPVELDVNDNMLHLIGGVTPMIRLGNKVTLFGDLSAIGNIRQTLTIDGTQHNNKRDVDGFILNASIGLNFYLGSADNHADWYSKEDVLEAKVIELE